MLYFDSNEGRQVYRTPERRYADHTFIQIYFRMHQCVVKFSIFCSPRAARGHWPPNQNPADVPVYSMIAAPILEYIFITVTCCEEIAKTVFEHFLQLLCVCDYRHCISRLQHCLANSRTFQDIALRFPALSRTKLVFQDFPGSGNFRNTIPRLYPRRGKPCLFLVSSL